MGGSASVWDTALLFFQITLLIGYAYAHALSRLGIRQQLVVHGLLLAAGIIFLPPVIEYGWLSNLDAFPVAWLLTTVGAAIGVPFLALAGDGESQATQNTGIRARITGIISL